MPTAPLRSRAARIAVTALLAVWVSAGRPALAAESVRIAVGRFRDEVIITGADLVATGNVASDIASSNAAGGVLPKALRFSANKGGMLVDGKPVLSDVVRVRARGTLTLRAHGYRHELEVRFRLYDKKPELLVVHPIDLELYVAGIVSAELPQGWPLEAYKAQAVAARTFALRKKYERVDLPYHMEASVLDQVYAGVEREHALAARAAQETAGLVLTFDRHLAQAYFHASCGDRTESALEGWGTPLPYLPGSACGYCRDASRFGWQVQIARSDVDAAFKALLHEPVLRISIAARSKTGRVLKVLVAGKSKSATIAGADLRRLLGYTRVWSTWIDSLELGPTGLRLAGKGAGHGVGLCQWGARGLARAGKSYTQILSTYYPGAPLRRVY